MIKALIFDFDGLILETEGPVYLSWQELYQSLGFNLSYETWATIIGTADGSFDPHKELESLVGGALDWDKIEPLRRTREQELVETQPILPGVEAYLKDAKRLGLKIGLASSSSCQWVTGHLTRLGLIDYFDCIYGSDDVQCTKPDPELYLAVLGMFNLRGDQAIVLEDSPNGVLAAKRAGTFCVAVPNEMTRQLPLEQADLRIDSLADLSLEELLEIVGRGSRQGEGKEA